LLAIYCRVYTQIGDENNTVFSKLIDHFEQIKYEGIMLGYFYEIIAYSDRVYRFM